MAEITERRPRRKYDSKGPVTVGGAHAGASD